MYTKIKLTSLGISLMLFTSLVSCEDDTLTASVDDVCSEAYVYTAGNSFLTNLIAEIEADNNLTLLSIDKYENEGDIFYAVTQANGARGFNEITFYTCTESILNKFTEDKLAEFRETVLPVSLFLGEVYTP